MTEVPLDGLEREVLGLRVAVTGADSYLGRQLVRALRRMGCAVLALDRTVSDPKRDGARWEQVDAWDAEILTPLFGRVDVVFHAASERSASGMAPAEVRARLEAVNVAGTRAVIDACRAGGVRRLVHTSTVDVVGHALEADESAPYASEFYRADQPSLIAAERLVRDAHGEDLATVALRPAELWGPGEGGPAIWRMLEVLAANRFRFNIGDGKAWVDRTHVLSLVRAELLAAIALVERPEVVGGHAYFITDDERLHGVDWYRPLVAGLGYEFPDQTLPGWMALAIAWVYEVGHWLGWQEPWLTRPRVRDLTRSSAYRIDAARRDLGYEPLVTSFEGQQSYLDDYRRVLEGLKGTSP